MEPFRASPAQLRCSTGHSPGARAWRVALVGCSHMVHAHAMAVSAASACGRMQACTQWVASQPFALGRTCCEEDTEEQAARSHPRASEPRTQSKRAGTGHGHAPKASMYCALVRRARSPCPARASNMRPPASHGRPLTHPPAYSITISPALWCVFANAPQPWMALLPLVTRCDVVATCGSAQGCAHLIWHDGGAVMDRH